MAKTSVLITASRKLKSTKRSRLRDITVVAIVTHAWIGCALAAQNAEPAGIWERPFLTDDSGGSRSALEDAGWTLGATYVGETLGNVSGGVNSGFIYEGRLELSLDADLDKIAGWTGATFHVNAYQIHGRGLSAHNLGGNLLIASSIEATPATRLFDLWLQQNFAESVSLRVGQLAADEEFVVSEYAATFTNATFGWPAIFAVDLPSGGPAYPLATPGARIKITPTESFSLAAAVFNGDPAGAGEGDPQRRNAHGMNFRVNDDVFAIVEAAYSTNQKDDAAGLPATYKIGGWFHSGRFDDQRFDASGLSLADPASGEPGSHRSNVGLYAVADQMIWRRAGTADQGLGLFLRVAGTPQTDRNQVAFYADGGLTFKGPIPGREDDTLGLGIAYASISPDARALDRDERLFGQPGHPIRDAEAVLELTYQAQLTPWWMLQPDFQFIRHPGGNVPTPRDSSGVATIPDAVVIGLRTTLRL